MLEIYVKKINDNKQLMLIEDGSLIEHYDSEYVDNKNEGDIFVGVVRNILNSMAAAFVDIGTEKNSFIQAKDIAPQVDEKKFKKIDNANFNIGKMIRPGQKILVQVKKDSNSLKGARISSHITIPSKYIVFMPNTDFITISQKITNKTEQDRLIKIVRDNIGEHNGAVIRTSAEGKENEIIDDIKRVVKTWKKIQEDYQKYDSKKPGKLYSCPDILEKMLLDIPGEKIERIRTNDDKELETIKKLINNYTELKHVTIEKKEIEEFEKIYEINKQIERIDKRKIWLKCGGFITIDPTEALTAIDVNTGKYTEGKDYYDVIFTVNKQATIEIAKQLRLRDIGGIIIIDYIDMSRKGDKEKIEELLKECLKNDRAKTQVEGFTKLDLLELTRKHICSHKG